MDQKTQEALTKLGKVVDTGTKPTGEATMPKSADQQKVEDVLKEVQAEQQQDPEKFAPALKEVPVEDIKEETPTETAPAPVTNTEVEKAKEVINQELTEAEPVICQKCGWDVNNGVITPTEDEVREFTRCLLGERGFEKDYEYLGGGLKATFKELSATDKDKLTEVLKTIPPEGPNRVYIEVISDMRKIQTMATLSKIKSNDVEKNITLDLEGDKQAIAVLEEFDKVVGKYPATLVDILLRGYIEFDRLLNALTEAAFDENFWEGAGLELPQKPTVSAP